MVTISLYNLVDTFWIAKLGYQAVAALTATMPFFILTMALGVGTGIGVNALSSRRFGERNTEAANQATGQTFFLCLALGIILILATNIFPRQILIICGAPVDVLGIGEEYIRMMGFAMPLIFFGSVSRNVFQASGDAIKPMIFIILSQVINVVLDPFLIFGWGPFPEMGIAGAALATAIAAGFGSLLAVWYILSGRTAYRIRVRHCIPHFRTIGAIYRVGLPSMFMEMTESVGFALFNHVASGFGSIVLAAVGIAGRVADLAFMPIIGTAHGLLPIVGFSLGARLWKRLWSSVRLAVIWLTGIMLLSTIFLEVFTPQVISVFNSDPALLEIAVPGMRIFCSTLALVGPTVIFITTFQGLSKAKDAMILSLGRQFIFFIPWLFLLSYLWGLNGVWIAMPMSDTLGFMTAAFWIYREYRLRKRQGDWKEEPLVAEPEATK